MSCPALSRIGIAMGVLTLLSVALNAQAPANDECVAATPLSIGNNGPFDSTNATSSLPAFSCSVAAGEDVWHAYTAVCTGRVTFQTCGSAIDTAIELFDGTCAALNVLACDDNGCGLQSSVRALLTQGATYYLRVGIASGTTGAYQVQVSHSGNLGTFTSVATDCGSLALTPSGAPTVAGTIRYEMTGVVGTPFLWFGLPIAPLSICPSTTCALGADIGVAGSSTVFQFTLPCDPTILGGRIAVQGADMELVTGSCPAGEAFHISFSNTIVTQIL